MIIHKGDSCTIEASGAGAVKERDGIRKEVPFYPERDVEAVAGEIDERSAWQLLHDVAVAAAACATPILPSHILIDGNGFRLSEWSESTDLRFEAPEGPCGESARVWALGATLFFVFMGSHVFHGLGGRGQASTTPVPVLRRELPQLSALVGRCLQFSPSGRPSLVEIVAVAEKNLERLGTDDSVTSRPLKKTETEIDIDEAWPEEMK